ncbi:AAA family ATPase [Methylobacterium sp. J-092]|uniref:AAA family ATPase n=1 Tax=Methylobacterium sp. J-092 TaxID=2836667 RepID=UPI001FBBD6DF|nr:AAA family ATPase [Methylobacterium sp. J-092]MCJ2009582.1 AAA family ATPase [Methylobacterium sp. J-092]
MTKRTATKTTTKPVVEFPEDELLDDRSHALPDGLKGPHDTLASLAVAKALKGSDLRRIRKRGVAVVVEIPTADIAAEVELVIRGLGDFGYVFNRTGTAPRQDKPTEGNQHVAAHLGSNDAVLGISTAPERYLPSTLVASADVRVTVQMPGRREIGRAILLATGRPARRMPPDIGVGLDFGEICSAIRVGSSPARCVRRLQAASAAKFGSVAGQRDVPPLEALHGYGEAADWAKSMVRDLADWRAGRVPWEAVTRTCVLASAPGLGKTTFVRSVAKSAGLPLITTNVAAWFSGSSGHLDGVIKEADRVFGLAAAQAPAILFLDELDGLPDRARLTDRAREWWTPVVNSILLALDASMSGPASRLVVIGATNHADKLDAALVRPGRLHPVISIKPPDTPALAGIMRQHLGGDLAGVDLMPLAHLAAGSTGAEVAGFVKGARQAAREAGRPLAVADLAARIAPSGQRTAEETLIAARHEAAHAVASEALGVGTVRDVSIVLRETTVGMTRSRLHHRLMMTRPQVDDAAVVALVGRAQDERDGHANSGAGGDLGSDLATATGLIAMAHATHGLGDGLLFLARREDVWPLLWSDADFRVKVQRDLDGLYARAKRFVSEHREAIEVLADRLVADLVVGGDDVRRILADHGVVVQAELDGGRHAAA